NKNELINIDFVSDNEIDIITTKGTLRISRDDAEAIRRGYFPSGIKDSPYLEGILKKTIRNNIVKVLKPKKENDGKNQATMLWELIKSSYFFTDILGYPYVVVNNIPMAIENQIFADYLASIYYSSYGIVPNNESISLVTRLARAEARKNILSTGVRIGLNENAIVYDPVNEDGSVFLITTSGINEIIPTKPMTVRYNGMLTSVIQEGNIRDLKSLLSLWNLSQSQEVLIAGYIGTTFVPNIPHVILITTGPHGAGKSSLNDAIKTIVDPNVVMRNTLRTDEKEVAISGMHEWVLNFDNVNTIIPDPISDLLCRISTGQGYRKRKLYTDQDDVILRYIRPVLLNGISEPGYNPDFLDRALILRLKLIPESQRRTDAEIQRIISDLAPKIRGAYLDALKIAIGIYPQVAQEYDGKLLRMADFIIWGEAITRALGYSPGSFFDSFSESQKEEITSTAEENLLITVINELLKEKKVWEGTTTELFEKIEEISAKMDISDALRKQLPKNYRDLGRKLSMLIPNLRALQIEVTEDLSDKNRRVKKIKRIEEQKTLLGDSNRGSNVGNVGMSESKENTQSQIPTCSDNGNSNVGKNDPDLNNHPDNGNDNNQNTDNKTRECRNNVGNQEHEKSTISDNTDITDKSSSVKGSSENNFFDEISGAKFGYNFYRIKSAFLYEFQAKDGKTIKVICRAGQVRKIDNKTAIRFRPFLERACPDGSVWDPVSQQCVVNISDLGGSNNE
ncbi:MAG: hypothetical protein QXZ17_12825, partial [Nitrososphaerota archaeon]